MPGRRGAGALPAMLALALAVVVGAAGCATPAEPRAASPTVTSPQAPPAPPAPPAPHETPLLSPAAVPGLAVLTRPLPAAQLAKDASIADLRAELARDSYAGGRERTFQGPSRRLTQVTSRSLVFAADAGADAFLAYLRAHSADWFGLTTEVSTLTSAGRRGWLFRPPLCACHLANPVLVGVVRDGRRLTWLSINGPAATTMLLDDLLSPDLSTPA